MLDFNTKKDILKRLRRKGSENVLMRVLCAVAAAFVKLWYGVVCGIGMAFSDKNGNFLGIRTRERRPKARRQDDIVYVKKPLVGRVMSVVLAAAFVLMIAPELSIDLGIKASAVGTATLVHEDVSNTDRYFIPNDTNTFAYLEDEYNHATDCISAEVTDFTLGYGKINIAWQPIINNGCGHVDINIIPCTSNNSFITGYTVNITSSKGFKYSNDYPATQFSTEIEGLPTEDSLTVSVIPKVQVLRWGFMPADPNVDDSKPIVTRQTALDPIMPELLKNQKSTEIGIPNATFDPPVIITPAQKESRIYRTEVELKWEDVKQIGGGTDAGASADGYNIYRSKDGGKFVLIETINDTEYTDKTNVSPGGRYEYFIEAYRSAWGSSAYNPNNKGLVTSSKVGITDDNINAIARGSIYKNQLRTVYIAPAEPDLVVKSSPQKNIIELKWGPTSGDYSGVILFRTTGEDSELDPNNLNLGDQRFSDWLLKTAENKQNSYGLERLAQLAKNQNTYEDSDIIEGETYWYYAVAYLNIGDGDWLYGSAARNSSKLNLTLARPIGLTAENRDGQVYLTWEAVSGAQGYEIEITKTAGYNSAPGEQFPQTIYESYDNYNKTNFLHNYLYNTDGYTYRVRAYINIQSVDDDGVLQTRKRSSWSQPTMIYSVGLPMSIPQNVAANGSVDGQITVTWDRVQGAASYTLYYENMNNSADKGKVDGLTNNRYVHTNLENGERYSYYVVAHKEIKGDGSKGTQLVDSSPSGVAKAKVGVGLVTPQDLKLTTKDGEITVTWAAVAGAQGYLLYYRKNNEPFNEKNVFDLTRTSFNHTRLQNGDTYNYYVVAYKEVSGARDFSPQSLEVGIMVGVVLDTPKDFTADTKDGTVNLKWTAVKGAEGYIVYASSGGEYHQFDVSKTTYSHTGLENGSTWSYRVAAYKTVNGARTYSTPSETKTVSVGVSLNSAVDLTATAGNRQIDLKWTAVKGAEGYVVYLYNSKTMEFDPITATSKTSYSHVGLKNGKQYTYMVAPYKNIDGKRYYGDYSMSVTAIPTTGSITDMDHELRIKGTSPYGISHGEYISAVSNHGAFDESVDVYFTTNRESTQAIKDVLKNYAEGLSSFIVYPFDISIYKENTFIKVDPADGYFVTITMPIPDRLIAYRDYITVIHINENAANSTDITEITLADDWIRSDDQRLEVLPCAIVDIDNVWCVQFKCTNFSPYALVIYKEHISDISTGGGILDGGFAGTFNSGVLLFTALPDIMPNTRRLRIVQDGAKRYRIKRIDRI